MLAMSDFNILQAQYIPDRLLLSEHKESSRAVKSYISPCRKEGSAKATGIDNCTERLLGISIAL
jgi:hypothetical protein